MARRGQEREADVPDCGGKHLRLAMGFAAAIIALFGLFAAMQARGMADIETRVRNNELMTATINAQLRSMEATLLKIDRKIDKLDEPISRSRP